MYTLVHRWLNIYMVIISLHIFKQQPLTLSLQDTLVLHCTIHIISPFVALVLKGLKDNHLIILHCHEGVGWRVGRGGASHVGQSQGVGY